MGRNNLLITIIVAVLNGSATLERCIKSIIGQRVSFKELIVMDGGSTDKTISILKAYNSDIAFWESNADRGIYHAWNKALIHSHGEWLCFLGSDDYFLHDGVLACMIPYLNRATDYGTRIVYGQVTKVDRQGRVIKLEGKTWEKISWMMRHGMPLIHSGIFHKRSLFDEHGLFDESYKIAGDYEFLLRELKTTQALFAEGIRTVAHEIGGLSDSHKIETLREISRARRKHGFPAFSWVWTIVYIRALLQKRWKQISRKKSA